MNGQNGQHHSPRPIFPFRVTFIAVTRYCKYRLGRGSNPQPQNFFRRHAFMAPNVLCHTMREEKVKKEGGELIGSLVALPPPKSVGSLICDATSPCLVIPSMHSFRNLLRNRRRRGLLGAPSHHWHNPRAIPPLDHPKKMSK